MGKYLFFLIFIALLSALLCLLYRSGLAVSKSIRALLFVYRPGKRSCKLSLDACTGWLSHAVRFPESRLYTFTLDARLSSGDAELLLLDRQKRPLLRLTPRTPSGTIELDAKSRCRLRWELSHATGQCELRW